MTAGPLAPIPAMALGHAPTTTDLGAMLQAQQMYGANAATAAQRSQLLQQVLADDASGAQNIRGGWGELAGRLGAEFIASRALRNDTKTLADAVAGYQQRQNASDLAAIGGAGSPTSSSAPSPAPLAGQGGGAPAIPSPVAGAPTSPDPLTQALDPDWVRMVAGEARGESPTGQMAAGAVALNRARESGMSLHDVVTAPHQFEGYRKFASLQPGDPLYDRTAAILAPLLSGEAADPTNGADAFYAPHAQAALGRARPAWDDGSGMDIGGQRFFHLGYQAPAGYQGASHQPQMAQAAPQLGPSPGGGPPQTGGGMQPFDVATAGPITPGMLPPPTPGASSPPPGGQPPPQGQSLAVPQPGGAGGGASPGAGAAPPPPLPTGPAASPAEIAMVQRLQNSPNPADRQAAHEMALKLQERAATPAALGPNFGYVGGVPTKLVADDGYRWSGGVGSPQVSNHPVTRMASAPNTIALQHDDGSIDVKANPAYGSLPAGTGMTADGSVVALRQPQMITAGGTGPAGAGPGQGRGGAPGAGGAGGRGLIPIGQLVQHDPVTGELKADPRLDQALQVSREAQNAPEVKEYSQMLNAYGGITRALQSAVKNNGLLDTSFVDATGRVINPGRAMTVGSTKLWLEHFGLPQELVGKVMNVIGKGYITPQSMNDGLGVMAAYAASAHDNAAERVGKAAATLATFGVQDPALTVPNVPGSPTSAWLHQSPFDAPPSAAARPASPPPGPGVNGSGGRQVRPLQQPGGDDGGGPPVRGLDRLPHPQSPEEARRLPPGQRFVTPDGRVLVNSPAGPR